MKRYMTPLSCLIALTFLVLPVAAATPELPEAAAPAESLDALQSVDGCDQPVVDPELAEFGLVPEPTLMAPLCGPCSIGECRNKALGSGCALHAEEPVPGTCTLASTNKCFDGTAICTCSPN